MKPVYILSSVLVLIGALNWGLWGLFQFDLVATLFGGNSSTASRVIYSLVGIAAVIKLTDFGKDNVRPIVR